MRKHTAACTLLATAFALYGCNSSAPLNTGARAGTTPQAEKPEKSLASYLHDLSPKLEGVTADNAILEHYSIPTSDGTILDGWVRRPPIVEPAPLVLVFSPYYGGGDPSFALNALGEPSGTFAAHLVPYGYAVGFVSVAGTGNSSGCFHNGGPIERRQLADAVQYFAGQRWSNGAVGAIGVSYDGTTANELFVEAPPALKTVVPMEAITDYYRYTFNSGGIARADTTFFSTYYLAYITGPVGLEGGISPTDPPGFVQKFSGQLCPEQLAIQQDSVITEITADKTPYWHDRDAIELILHTLDKPRPSMFYVQGFQDANVDPQMADGFLEAVAKTGVPLHVWFGQWVHAYPEASGCQALEPCRGDFFELALLAWFDQFLKGRKTGILDAPAVQLQADDGVWRHEKDWPPAVVKPLHLFPQSDGTLGFAAGDGAASYLDAGYNRYNEANTGLVIPFPQPPGASVQFVSEPLEKDLRLTGLPRLTTLATASNVRANLVATLLEHKSDGSVRYLNFGALSLNHAETLDRSDPDITDKPLTAAFNFYPQDNVVAAGSQLVLHLAGDVEIASRSPDDFLFGDDDPTNFLRYGMNLLPISVGATVTLDLAQTRLELPVNPGNRAEPLSWLGQDSSSAPVIGFDLEPLRSGLRYIPGK